MAHRIKNAENIHVDLGNRVVLKRPHMAALLGAIAAEWSHVERQLTHLYATLLGLRRGPPVTTKIDDSISETVYSFDGLAYQIFEAAQTIDIRFKLLTKIVDSELHGVPKASEELSKTVRPSLWAAARSRNDLVHARWIVSKDYPNDLIMVPPNGARRGLMLYEESDFNEALNKIIAAHNPIIVFEKHILDGFA